MTIQNTRKRPRTASAGVALWRHIADEIERGILHRRYKAGDRLPGENEIAERFDANRHTVRRAIAALTERGLLRAERGSGTFVEEAKISYAIGKRTRFSENISASGAQPGGQMTSIMVEPADAEIALRLQIAPQTPVVRIDAVRKANRIPLCVGTTWLEEKRFPDAGKIYAAVGSITQMLVHFGVSDYTRATTQVAAAIADAADAERLDILPGRPVLLVDSIDVDAAGRPILTSRTRFAADRVELSIER